ncbi:type II toxin-antitoxin system prevent-host-death family antitoxin [Mycobacterium sp. 663a-19]|uniref:type II toxin-antitoxin system Phd/YefM family antitoxin n=1 Tax=Mycobacterium sp. 663a-19 TaxID=2986148 RepID=UPI002D1F1F8D|nr:type II toxin-antitoxin system prevent-host-death family antitoxin [Mycobacterium sp. 663a-19]MEB3981500.1 type II toxin-antitoxin system prevent-host-death family antitoxin [Mycobacterium sp. 663a-19]
MKAIGVRELRQNASKYLAEVATGESIEITDRGRPVARLVPITGDPWQDLITTGEVVRAARPVSVDDIEPRAYRHSASKSLEELRSNER